MADPLQTLARLNQRSLDDAQAALAAALSGLADAEAVAVAARQALDDEMSAAHALDAGDHVVEAFVAWLPGAQARVVEAEAAVAQHQGRANQARAAVAAARTAAETVQHLIDTKASRKRADAQRREDLDAPPPYPDPDASA